MKALGLVLSSVLISGCLPMGGFQITETSSPDSFSVPIIVTGRCGADDLQQLLGQNESALASVSLPAGTRFVRTGYQIIPNAIPTRLNIAIAADGTIVHVECG